MKTMTATNDALPGVNDPSDLSADWTWGTVFEDFDNDGDEDLYVGTNGVGPVKSGEGPVPAVTVPSYLFRNEMIQNNVYSASRKFHFRNIQYESGIAGVTRQRGAGGARTYPDNHAVVTGDFDRDGRVDIFAGYKRGVTSSLFKNDSVAAPGAGGYIQIMLIGDESNRSAIGARVECVADLDGLDGPNGVGDIDLGERQIREVMSGHSNNASTSDLVVHFGVGKATEVKLTIKWPSGIIQTWAGNPQSFQGLLDLNDLSMPELPVTEVVEDDFAGAQSMTIPIGPTNNFVVITEPARP